MQPYSNLRGIALMIAASLMFVVNDTFMKLATEGLPPFQTLFLRGVMAMVWCLPLVLVAGHGKSLRYVADKWVVLRNLMEMGAVLCFIVALANMPIADITALGQTAPLLLLIGVALIYREKIGGRRLTLIGVGFVGALLVAQPGAAGVSPFAVLGIGVAVGSALRDIVTRKVARHVPGLIVALSAILIVMVGALAMHLIFETWVEPRMGDLLFLLASGFFLTFGHLCIFLAYRHGEAGAVAPFFYMFSVWALLSGLVVFGTFPNALALTGIGLILASGVVIVLLDERQRRLTIVA